MGRKGGEKMRTALVVLGLLALCTVPASATSFGLPNEVTNGQFDGFDGWNMSGNYDNGPEGQPGPSLRCMSNWGRSEATAQQQWAADPGTYDVDISFWYKIWDNSPAYASSVHVDFTVDGVVVWSFEDTESLDTWIYVEDIIEGVEVVAYKDIHIYLVGDGQGSDGWGIAMIDAIDVEQIPEPGTMVLLGSGLMGLVAFARRRRR
jgi:hypothetical protein